MKKNEKNSKLDRLTNPRLVALWMLRSTKENPCPRLVRNLDSVMPSDLVKRKELKDG